MLAKMSIFIAYKAAGYKRVFSNTEADQHSKVSHPLQTLQKCYICF